MVDFVAIALQASARNFPAVPNFKYVGTHNEVMLAIG
jgi:hypothetical protein